MSDGNPVALDPKQKREHWQRHIEGWPASGLSQVAYCRQNDIKPHQWSYWKKRLSRTDSGVSFVPLKIACNLPMAAAMPAFSLLTPNGYKIDVGVGFDPVALKQLLNAVQSL